jgi:hypothetical protein
MQHRNTVERNGVDDDDDHHHHHCCLAYQKTIDSSLETTFVQVGEKTANRKEMVATSIAAAVTIIAELLMG